MRVHRCLEIGDILLQFALTLAVHLTGAHRAGVLRCPALIGEALEKAGILLEVSRRVARAVAGEPGVTVLDVSGVADLGRLAVADDVDTGRHLFGDSVVYRLRHGGVKGGRVVSLLPLTGKDEIHNFLGAGQAAHMGGFDHDCPSRLRYRVYGRSTNEVPSHTRGAAHFSFCIPQSENDPVICSASTPLRCGTMVRDVPR